MSGEEDDDQDLIETVVGAPDRKGKPTPKNGDDDSGKDDDEKKKKDE